MARRLDDRTYGDGRAFRLTFLLAALISPAAIGLAILFSLDIGALLAPRPDALFAGIIATAPPVAFLAWIMRSRWPPIVRFRQSQLHFFSEIGFRFMPVRIVLLALAAGIGEELLFRGVLQTVASRDLPVWAAVLLPNVLFGALHARTAIYAVSAAIVGTYLGVLFWATGSLAAPIVTHALYDLIALEWTRRALKQAAAD